jgi:para-nitrobenzyl esterase
MQTTRKRRLIAVTSPLTSGFHQAERDAPVAHTGLGVLRGAWIDGVAAFLGVPYALPPVGALRLAPASPVQSWKGQFDATRHGPISPQPPPRLRAIMGNSAPTAQDENCLTLTIRTPAPDAKARPVIVWLHGGAWISGSGSGQDTTRLVCEGDLVVVGVNYRLGALGWLHRSGIVDAEAGISDMIAALSWVRDHIAGFGGDPANVTVMGHSAGATSIGRLLMLPEARRLFRRVIMQSSAFGRGFYPSSVATQQGDRFLRLLDIDPDARDALQRLRAIPVPRILQAQSDFTRANARFGWNTPPFMPVSPVEMTEADTLATIADGATGRSELGAKDLLIGANADEMHAFFVPDPAMVDPPADLVIARFGGEAKLAHYRARRPGGTAMDVLADLGTDEIYLRPAMRLADAVSARGGNVYAYFFDWAPPVSRTKSCHTIELPFVFGTLESQLELPTLAGGDAAQMAGLSSAMLHGWAAFARFGAPAHAGLPAWPRYDAARRPTMRFGTRIGIVNDPAGLG